MPVVNFGPVASPGPESPAVGKIVDSLSAEIIPLANPLVSLLMEQLVSRTWPTITCAITPR
jgi:hypothetical protein